MSLRFHWFLPTNGDGRNIVGGGHGVATGAAGDDPAGIAGLPRADRPERRTARVRGRPYPDRGVVRGRLAGHRHAHRGGRAAEVPCRVPARPDFAHAFRADGRDVPALLQGPLAAQRGDRRGVCRAAGLRRLPRQGTTVRAMRRVPRYRHPAVGGGDRRLRGNPPARAGGPADPAAGPGAGPVLRRVLGRGGAGGGTLHRRVPDLGRAPGRGGSEAPLDRGPGRAAPHAVRYPAARHQPGHGGRGVAAGGPADRGRRRGDDPQGSGRPGDQRVRGPAADARPARRVTRRAGGLAEPVGGRRAGPRRRRDRAGWQPHRGRRPARCWSSWALPCRPGACTSPSPSSPTWARPSAAGPPLPSRCWATPCAEACPASRRTGWPPSRADATPSPSRSRATPSPG